MSKLEMFRSLYDYNEWASGRVLEAASRLTEEELLRERDIPHVSIAAELRHIASAQDRWLCLWTDTEWRRLPEVPRERTMETLRDWFEDSHWRLRAFVSALEEGDLDRTLLDTGEEEGPQEFRL